MKIKFSIKNYKESVKKYAPPCFLSPFTKVDRVRYRKLEARHYQDGKKTNDIAKAFDELKRRTCKEYFHKVYPIQTRTLDYASLSFPAYRFILPEVITEDWLATVDWHKFQRDHVLHQPLTAYITLELLGNPTHNSTDTGLALQLEKSLLDTCVEDVLQFKETAYIKEFLLACGLSEDSIWLKPDEMQSDPQKILKRCLWKQLFVETAYLAAVFHDLGYPWQYVGLIGNKLEHVTTPAMIQVEAIEHSILNTYKERLIYVAMNGYNKPTPSTPAIWEKEIKEQTKKVINTTHGFPGALGFLFLNDCIRQYPDRDSSPIRQLCVEWAAVAIMMHDMSKIYHGDDNGKTPERPHLRLDARVDPLSTLITLADLLQDFERPVGKFNSRNDEVLLNYGPACTSTEITVVGNVLTIKYIMEAKDLAFKRYKLHEEQEEYFHPRYGFMNLQAWGIENVVLKAY